MTPPPEPSGRRLRHALHVTDTARRRYGIDPLTVDARGRVHVADETDAERLAERIRRARDIEARPDLDVGGARLVAAGLLDEAVHLLLARYREQRDPVWTARLEAELRRRLGHDTLFAAATAFARTFPPRAVMRRETSAEAWLASTVANIPASQIVLEERLAVRVAAANPALATLRELVDESVLGPADAELIPLLEQEVRSRPGLPATEAAGETLWSLLTGHLRASPHSLAGQLRYLQESFGPLLGDAFASWAARFDTALDLLREAEAGAPPGPPGPPLKPDVAAWREAPGEAFTHDAAWMPSLVLVAKNAYVWLTQLGRRYRREVRRLDQVPDEALAELAEFGFRGLWLIGLWERSEASARIKRARGQEDAIASAYALADYVIAQDLGGEAALNALRERARQHGLRLAADMVPNHVGLDGRWVVERPDLFLQLPQPPYPGYRFTGPNLSGDPRIEVRIEDGYWSSRDAAVVFERTDVASGVRRYLYHGNDGTAMPWNDTAQLDVLKEETRAALIDQIVEVARRFDVIRFDAAMTLAKRHVQRLWYPPPGQGGAIPSRASHGAMPDEEFHRRMPREFWREVVERVARDAPDTLLLAEAFWMMEGYFVRTLGMHRVYNSAFMHMTAREANDEHQALLQEVLAFDPRILQRFVNFMNNPDEETARAQFGDGDKAFAVTTLLATLPGLPMFGHGQVEGLREKYGMEYHRAKFDEAPEPWMIARHRREIAPLLARREAFAGTERFRLFRAATTTGQPAPDLYAYANAAPDGTRYLVLVHNRYAEVDAVVRETVPFVESPGEEPRTSTLAEVLGLQGGANRFLRWREVADGLERIVPTNDILRDGLRVRMGAYGARVWSDVREMVDEDGRLTALHEELQGRGVADLEEAFASLTLAPLQRAFVAVASGEAALPTFIAALRAGAPEVAAAEVGEPDPDRFRILAARSADLATPPGPAWGRAWALAAAFADPAEALRRLRLDSAVEGRIAQADAHGDTAAWAAAWKLTLQEQGYEDLPGVPDRADASAAAEDEHDERDERDERNERYGHGEQDGLGAQAAPSAAEGAATAVEPDAASDKQAPSAKVNGQQGDVPDPVDAGTSEPDPSVPQDAADRRLARELAALLGTEGDDASTPRDPLASLLGVHQHDGTTWFRREGYRLFVAAFLAAATLRGAEPERIAAWRQRFERAERRSGYRFQALRRRLTGSA